MSGERPERRLLVVAYFFPPVGGVGVERTLKHVTYLPGHGWQPVVVAPANSAYRLVDRRLLRRVPVGTEVFRAPTLEPGHALALVRRLRRVAGRLSRAAHDGAEGRDRAADAAAGSRRQAPGAARRLANAAWARAVGALFFPDEQLVWAASAVLAGWRAAADRGVSAIYSSSPPVSGHLAAGVLKRLLGVPWVADFRDPWIGNAFAHELAAPHRALQASLEASIVRSADRVILATEAVRLRYAARYPRLAARFLAIPNGYDLRELGGRRGATPWPAAAGEPAGDEPRGAAAPFRIVYAGSIYGDHELELFLDGVALLLARRPELGERLRVEFVGWLNERNRRIAAERMPGLEPVVRYLGLRPREEAIAAQRSADAALLLLADGPGREDVVQAKLYEYLGLDLPILAVAPPGETRRILGELGWGVVTDPTPSGVADGLERIIDWRRPRPIADVERRYERARLSARLAEVLDAVAGPVGAQATRTRAASREERPIPR